MANSETTVGEDVFPNQRINVIVALLASNRGIGYKGTTPWRILEDLKMFKEVTSKAEPEILNAVLMGRTTWDSIPPKMRPLVGRINYVLTSHPEQIETNGKFPVFAVSSFDEAISHFRGQSHCNSKLWVIGGVSPYEEALAKQPVGSQVMITKIYSNDVILTDRFFPKLDKTKYVLVESGPLEEARNERDTPGLKYKVKIYRKYQM